MANLLGRDAAVSHSRTPAIMSDAAHSVLVRAPGACSGNFFIADEALPRWGTTRLADHRAAPGAGRLRPGGAPAAP